MQKNGTARINNPETLSNSPYGKEHALFLDRNLLNVSPHIHSLFERTAYCDPQDIGGLSLLRVRKAGFQRLVFSNPYSSKNLRNLYNAARAQRFPMLVCERGALPGTVALDETGFLADSFLFEIDRIPDLTAEMPSLADLRLKYFSRPTLEPQSAVGMKLIELERVLDEKKTVDRPRVLIALQDSQDTAVRYFKREGEDYASFLRFAEMICENFSDKCEFVFKPHPREPDTRIAGARSVAHLHITDALASANHVLCFSSGVGVLALLMECSVGFYGLPFYHQCKAARLVSDPEKFTALISEDKSAKLSAARQFLHHLGCLYSDVEFFGRRWNFVSDRDIGCRYKTIRIGLRKGYFERAIPQARLVADDGIVCSVRRFAENRTRTNYHDFLKSNM